MPVSRSTTARISERVGRVWREAERRILASLAEALDTDDEPMTARRRSRFRRRVRRIIDRALQDARGEGESALIEAVQAGRAAAEADIARLTEDATGQPPGTRYALDALLAEFESMLEGVAAQALRSADDAYRRATGAATSGVLTGDMTRREAAQQVLDTLASQGITGFTDRSGRRWNMASYAEMATRTATVRASVNGHVDRLTAAGFALVRVSDSPRECPLCRPWEGEVLSLTGNAGQSVGVDPRTGESVTVDVAASLAEAMAAGLFHPNCTHTIGAYLPGVTTERPDAAENVEGYRARQALRARERKVREWKRREAAAITPEARRKASGKVRYWQAQIRDLLADNDGLLRQRQREQITRAR